MTRKGPAIKAQKGRRGLNGINVSNNEKQKAILFVAFMTHARS